MAIFSTLRSRRMNHNEAQVIEQIIGFRLGKEWFALPILAIYKVITLGKVYGDPQNTGIGLTTYEGQEILVIDVAKQIFNQTASTLETTETSTYIDTKKNFLDLNQQRYLLILENITAETTTDFSSSEISNKIGLPIDSQPTMYRVKSAAFKALPKTYLARENIQCVSSEVIEIPNLPPLFVLNAQKLIASVKTR